MPPLLEHIHAEIQRLSGMPVVLSGMPDPDDIRAAIQIIREKIPSRFVDEDGWWLAEAHNTPDGNMLILTVMLNRYVHLGMTFLGGATEVALHLYDHDRDYVSGLIPETVVDRRQMGEWVNKAWEVFQRGYLPQPIPFTVTEEFEWYMEYAEGIEGDNEVFKAGGRVEIFFGSSPWIRKREVVNDGKGLGEVNYKLGLVPVRCGMERGVGVYNNGHKGIRSKQGGKCPPSEFPGYLVDAGWVA